MSPRHYRRPDLGITLTAAAIAVAATLAILLPVVLVPDDERAPIAVPVDQGPTTPTGVPLSAPPKAPSPAGRVLPARTRAPTTRATTPPPAGVRVMSWASGLCLGAGSADPTAGAPVVQQSCGPPLARRLELRSGPGGTASLTDTRSGLCIDVAGGSGGDNVAVQWRSCTGEGNQRFRREPLAGSGGRVRLVAAHSDKCLDVLNISKEAGGEIRQFGCHAPDDEMELRNQTWSIGG